MPALWRRWRRARQPLVDPVTAGRIRADWHPAGPVVKDARCNRLIQCRHGPAVQDDLGFQASCLSPNANRDENADVDSTLQARQHGRALQVDRDEGVFDVADTLLIEEQLAISGSAGESGREFDRDE